MKMQVQHSNRKNFKIKSRINCQTLNHVLHNQGERGIVSQKTSGNFSFHPNLELTEFFHFFKVAKSYLDVLTSLSLMTGLSVSKVLQAL